MGYEKKKLQIFKIGKTIFFCLFQIDFVQFILVQLIGEFNYFPKHPVNIQALLDK